MLLLLFFLIFCDTRRDKLIQLPVNIEISFNNTVLYLLICYRTNAVGFQDHFPQQTEEQWRSAGYREVGNYVVLVAHGSPISVFLFNSFLHKELKKFIRFNTKE